ncbi:MAG: 6-phosphogluconolactonase [Methylococcales bacterium]
MSKPQSIESSVINQGNLKISKDVDALCENVAKRIIECAKTAIDENGVFHFALAGGSTPQGVFERLATAKFSSQIDWQKTHIWFGDERCVPADHSDSNYRMANLALLSLVSISENNIHRIQGELEPAQVAKLYENEISQHLPRPDDGFPVFDLMLQGLGPDGHTASLFPGTPSLKVYDHAVTTVYVEKLDSWRVSVTFPVLNAAHNLLFLVAGAGKAEVIRDIFQQNSSTRQLYPVEMLKSTGSIEWFLDDAAASLVKTQI